MLPTRTAKALQGVARDVVAACDRNLLDGVGHLLHGDVDETFCHLRGRPGGLASQLFKFFLHGFQAQGLVRRRAKHLGKVMRLDFSQHHIRIGHGQRAAPAVTGRPGVGASALRPHPKA